MDPVAWCFLVAFGLLTLLSLWAEPRGGADCRHMRLATGILFANWVTGLLALYNLPTPENIKLFPVIDSVSLVAFAALLWWRDRLYWQAGVMLIFVAMAGLHVRLWQTAAPPYASILEYAHSLSLLLACALILVAWPGARHALAVSRARLPWAGLRRVSRRTDGRS